MIEIREVPKNLDLFEYVSAEWFEPENARPVTATNNLYRGRAYGFLNVPRYSWIGILQSDLAPEEKWHWRFWSALEAGNWKGAVAVYPGLDDKARAAATAGLVRKIRELHAQGARRLAESYLAWLEKKAILKPEEVGGFSMEGEQSSGDENPADYGSSGAG